MILEDLQICNWMLPLGESDEETTKTPDAAACPVSPSAAAGSLAIDEIIVKAYTGLLSWCFDQSTLASDFGSSGLDDGSRSWLLPLLAQLCDSLSASPLVGAKWATLLSCKEAGIVLLSRVCHGQGFFAPVTDLVKACSPGKKVWAWGRLKGLGKRSWQRWRNC